jgi:hypothetical protein
MNESLCPGGRPIRIAGVAHATSRLTCDYCGWQPETPDLQAADEVIRGKHLSGVTAEWQNLVRHKYEAIQRSRPVSP